jgi:type IV pilus assembly protein PilP
MLRLKIGIASATLLLTACAGSDHRDLEQFVAESGDSLRGRVAPVAQASVPDAIVYQAFDQPDPFKPERMRPREPRTAGTSWTPPQRREALEAYPLDALHMVGSMARGGQRWALIKAPDNTVYRVARGNRIGQNFGAVALVTESAVTLSEHIQDGGGSWVERTSSLALQEYGESR